MAKKKRKKQNSKTTWIVLATLAVLILGSLGIQVPEEIKDFLNIPTEQTSKAPKSNTPVQTDTKEADQGANATNSAPVEKGKNPGPIEKGNARFTTAELADSQKGWIKYHELDNLERATGADALLKKVMVNTGTSANQAIRPPAFISGKAPYFHARGHLIGRQMGGSGDDPRNLVTLYQNPVNTPYMTKYENQIRAAMDQGQTVRYRVTPIYDGNNLMCKQVEMEAISLDHPDQLNFYVVILNEP